MQERKASDDLAIVTMTKDELAAFVAQEVRKALSDRDVLDSMCEHCTRMSTTTAARRTPYVPLRIEYKSKIAGGEDLPKWARDGNW